MPPSTWRVHGCQSSCTDSLDLTANCLEVALLATISLARLISSWKSYYGTPHLLQESRSRAHPRTPGISRRVICFAVSLHISVSFSFGNSLPSRESWPEDSFTLLIVRFTDPQWLPARARCVEHAEQIVQVRQAFAQPTLGAS